MAKICNSRAKVYETRSVIEDEPVEHIESEGECLIKQMVQKQLDTHADLEQELKREKTFKSVAETLPLTSYIRGETTLKEFELTTEKAAHIEELKSLGLCSDEIQILLNFEKDALTETYKKADKSILSARLQSILEKVESAQKEREDFQEQRSTSIPNRHHRELGLCVKPDSKHTKLLNFVLSCQKAKTDSRPLNHPINNLKNIEEELFGHLAKKQKKSIVYRPVKTSAVSKETISHIYSYQKGCTLWDITADNVDIPTRKKTSKSSDHIYTCKPEYLYTIKEGEIIPKHRTEHTEDKIVFKSNATTGNDEFVVSDKRESSISLIPLENISKSRLSLQEIKSTSKFSDYAKGTPSKVLYVKNLAGRVTKSDLVSLFGHFESDTGPRIVYRLLTGRMKGQAFVTFSSILLAEEAMKLVNGYILKGKPVILQYGKGKSDVDTVR